MSDVNNKKITTQFHGYLLSSGLLHVLQFLEDVFGGKMQSLSALANSLEGIIVFIVTLDFARLGDLGRNLWSNRRGIIALKSLRILV